MKVKKHNPKKTIKSKGENREEMKKYFEMKTKYTKTMEKSYTLLRGNSITVSPILKIYIVFYCYC